MAQLPPLGPLIGRGATADIYAGEQDTVIKLFHARFGPQTVAYEARVARAVMTAGVPCPALRGEMMHNGQHGLIYERVNGQTVSERQRAQVWRIASDGRLMANLHFDLHHAPRPAHAPDPVTSGVPRLHDRLRWNIEHAAPLPAALRAVALEILSHLPDGDAICHGDFHPGNIMLAEPDARPVLIDWMNAMVGDPISDVARTLVLIGPGMPPDDPGIPRWIITLARRTLTHHYLEQYAARCNLTRAALDAAVARWRIPMLAARLSEHITDPQDALLTALETAIAQQKAD